MKVLICNVPVRPESQKTVYPPLGALAVIQSLQAAGYEAGFYDIDLFRASDGEIKNYFLENRPDIVGISAPVSATYKFVKKLAALIKSVLAETVVIVGGRLAVSSGILLKFTEVDFCVVGEGEKIVVNLLNYISRRRNLKSEEELRSIKGLCFLNSKTETVFTGYDEQPTVDEIQDPDYSILEKYSDIHKYIISPFFYEQFRYDERSFQNHRKDKKLANVVTSRGCVNRCTFCHRWQKGIRFFSVDRIIQHIKHLMKHYNVGFISFGDESFGVSKKWMGEFIEKIKPLDILYRVAGICCESADPLILKKLKESGCVAVHYGFESGSERMLRVMEKKAHVELNVKVANWTHDAGMQTVPALVIGMPGETYDTVKETTNFVIRITEFLHRDPVISINPIVVLPGTPVYEYARYKGLLGRTLEDEEKYLIEVSDQGGASVRHLNLTDYPYFIVLGWIKCICWAARYSYYKKHNFSRLPILKLFWMALQIVFKRREIDKEFRESLYGNPFFCHLRYIIAPFVAIYKTYKDQRRLFAKRCIELIVWPSRAVFRRSRFTSYVSLREFLKQNENFEKIKIYRPEQL